MEMQREGIIIDCGRRIVGHNTGWVPPTKTNLDRYRDYKHKALMLTPTIEPSNFAWNFKNPKRSTLKVPKKKATKRIMETVAV